MIRTKNQLRFYIQADRIMSGLPINMGLRERASILIKEFLGIYDTSEFLRAMRKYAYYHNTYTETEKIGHRILRLYWKYRYVKLGQKLGFTIGFNVFGYGLLIPHNGTIVINGTCRVGNFAVLHTCSLIGGTGKEIGDALYLATGAKILRNIKLGDNVQIAANSLVNKSFGSGILLAGSPAEIKKESLGAWYELQGSPWKERAEMVMKLYQETFIGA